ncbi:MAG: hypothetical protein FGM32_08545 [Candidatus Kapabacteria bacterium]|nr:hypothetical protein [Candidatus Kapabacteria bacterium]
MRLYLTCIFILCMLLVTGCDTEPAAPVPRTLAEQVAAWKPRIIVEEQIGDSSPSWYLQTITPGDTICLGVARFRIDSLSVPDSAVWTLGQRVFTTTRFATTDIPKGTHTIRVLVRKRFFSEVEGKDTTVERTLERTFVSLDEGSSLAIGKWVPVNPSEKRIDTLRVLYKELSPDISPGGRGGKIVIGATRGCNTWNGYDDDVELRRYAMNFERRYYPGPGCSDLIGELVLSASSRGVYRYVNNFHNRSVIDSIQVRRVP